MASLVRTNDDPVSGAIALWFAADGWVPNNPRLPLILYRAAVPTVETDAAVAFEHTFDRNGWTPAWRDGVYPFHHYHSTAHEALGFARGEARLLLGGPNGNEVAVRSGDGALLPAGTGHCCLEASPDFLVVGAYPPGQKWDLLRRGLSQSAKARMIKLPFPKSDPFLGPQGPLSQFW